MGLLSRFFNDNITDAQKAIIDGLCISLCSDGNASNVEIAEAVGFVTGVASVDENKAAELLQESLDRIEADPDAVLASLYSLTQNTEEREAVLTAAIFIQYMDGQITDGEDEAMVVIADALKIDAERVQALIIEIEGQIEVLATEDLEH